MRLAREGHSRKGSAWQCINQELSHKVIVCMLSALSRLCASAWKLAPEPLSHGGKLFGLLIRMGRQEGERKGEQYEGRKHAGAVVILRI